MILEILWTFSITDLIQAIGVGLGFPTAVWGILNLFRKNKAQEAKISALQDIAFSQNAMVGQLKNQVEELSKQTIQFEYQSIIMKEGNDLLSEQIKLQSDALLNQIEYQEDSLEHAKKVRKFNIRPFFVNNGGGADGSSKRFQIKLKNNGQTAKILKIEEIKNERVTISFPNRTVQNSEIKSGQVLVISGAVDENVYLHNNSYHVKLHYQDIDENIYFQTIKGKGMSFSLENPTESSQD